MVKSMLLPLFVVGFVAAAVNCESQVGEVKIPELAAALGLVANLHFKQAMQHQPFDMFVNGNEETLDELANIVSGLVTDNSQMILLSMYTEMSASASHSSYGPMAQLLLDQIATQVIDTMLQRLEQIIQSNSMPEEGSARRRRALPFSTRLI